MECIVYKAGYKYQLKENHITQIEIKPEAPIDTEYLALTTSGTLTVKDGYAWDGPSGPTVDTLNFMRGSLVHDALYQLMREGHLDEDKHRDAADRLLQKMCKEDGMSTVRAWGVYQGVHLFWRAVRGSGKQQTPDQGAKGMLVSCLPPIRVRPQEDPNCG